MSVVLKGKNGNELELAFVRESYPDVQDGFGDSAWCTVVWRAANADDAWEETAPCMNFFEFRNLVEWLRAAGSNDETGSPELGEVELLEPELKFTVSQRRPGGVTIRVSFRLEDRPERYNVDADTDEAEFVDLDMDHENVRAAAESLAGEIAEFERANLKDDIDGARDSGIMGEPDEGLNILDRVEREPPGAGTGEDNAGNR